ncbi:hypothetical protein C5E07_12215 [Pseudoclavibacter sp. RFBJ3]|uniref:RDD family protein n=1 Tax=unclassified Pseudoclavibacter TaxID=2615177 RepID=UPI000CE88D4A|nr:MULTISPECIES: RDD family protein [unclassified Pseudoclavibacter]PPF36477.1 hypothetical protein C5E05_09505 [Pseudoclavibacter sp. AY1H1]PPF74441.1 hypothetical protein C5B99_13505 [Pseudoclavibacter sp. Z016]PPF82473.1 hypothetical protein C5C12_11290 [Pseudoclavibacter sp. RFBJ5]PPF91366.1 hypothetical protein C5E07_12215 [Pseudoclavibacter sp. RFBJ3]PPF96291.1 hypothetical protein C5C19_14905 [Pseudoclavibacter sp. RFBH5]
MATQTRPRERLSVSDEQLVAGEGVHLDVRPAGFALRAASAALDALVYMVGYVGLLILTMTVLSSDDFPFAIDEALMSAIALSLLVVCLVIAPCVVETLSHGRSVGKLATGLRIVRDDGGASGFRQALIRSLLGFIELYGTFGGIAIITGLVNGRAKRLGDILAGTTCQRERAPKLRSHLGPMPQQLIAWAGIADAGRLPDRTARRILDYLDQAEHLTPAHRDRAAGEIARETLPHVHPIPDVDADTYLRGLAVLRRDRELAALSAIGRRETALAPTLNGMPHSFPDRG